MASMSVPTISTIPPPAAPGSAPLLVNQSLPFAPGLRPEEFGTMIATTIADKLGVMLNGNRQYLPRNRPPPMGSCNFCRQVTHYIRSCEDLNWYVADNRCRKDMQGHVVNNDGTIICQGPGETFQQILDCLFSPARTSVMLELVSPQITSAQSYYVSMIVQPSKVMTHTIEDETNNPDIQPNATINRWIASILFDFSLIHVPGATHSPDGLSC